MAFFVDFPLLLSGSVMYEAYDVPCKMNLVCTHIIYTLFFCYGKKHYAFFLLS